MILASQFFAPFKKNVKDDSIKSHRLMLKAGMIEQLGCGLYFITPLGLRVLNKIERRVHRCHRKLLFNPCLATTLQPSSLWQESGRGGYGKETMTVKDRHDKTLILGATAEEVFTKIASYSIHSEKDLPMLLYNVQWKYRDEIRPRFGLIRSREFLMSDAYSFHKTAEESMECYQQVLDGYIDFFKKLDLDPIAIKQNDTGLIGGSVSHEIFIESDEAEDSISFERDGQIIQSKGIELAHVYHLGTKYSDPMNLKVNGIPVEMGCYGIGVSRTLAAMVQIFGKEGDRPSLFLPPHIAPFKAHVIANPEFMDIGHMIEKYDPKNIYFDDTDKRMGEKFAIADLIGAPVRVVIGQKFKETGGFELTGYQRYIDELWWILNAINSKTEQMRNENV